MSGHTPGPWTIEEQWHGIAIKAGKRTVARTSPWSNQEEWANARLIAVAPDLLVALQLLLEETNDPQRCASNGSGHFLSDRVRNLATEVIANAQRTEGR